MPNASTSLLQVSRGYSPAQSIVVTCTGLNYRLHHFVDEFSSKCLTGILHGSNKARHIDDTRRNITIRRTSIIIRNFTRNGETEPGSVAGLPAVLFSLFIVGTGIMHAQRGKHILVHIVGIFQSGYFFYQHCCCNKICIAVLIPFPRLSC